MFKEHASSGFITQEECEAQEAQRAASSKAPKAQLVASYEGWCKTPATWNTKHKLMALASRSDVSFQVISSEDSGWAFKRTSIYFKVSGTQNNVSRFVRIYEASMESVS